MASHGGVSNALVSECALQAAQAPGCCAIAAGGVHPKPNVNSRELARQGLAAGRLADQQAIVAEVLAGSPRVPGRARGHAGLPVELPRAVRCEGAGGQGARHRALLPRAAWHGALKGATVWASVGLCWPVIAELAAHLAAVASRGAHTARDVET